MSEKLEEYIQEDSSYSSTGLVVRHALVRMPPPCSKFGDASQCGMTTEQIGLGSGSWVKCAGHADEEENEKVSLIECQQSRVKNC